MFDSHVHSNFSGDSDMPAEIACQKAISLSLDGIAFTDHLDIDYPDFDDKFLIDFTKYSTFMNDLKSSFKSNLKVLKGIEVGLQPHVLSQTNDTVSTYDFDFVIASVHIIDKEDPYSGTYFNGKSKEESFSRYLQVIHDTIMAYDNFDVIGHIGYIRRYCSYEDRTLSYNEFNDIIDSILKRVISLGKGIEINSSGYRNNLGSPIPDYDIVKRFSELGGEIITIGSDAHYPEHIACDFKLVYDKLQNIGIKYVAHFESRKPVFQKI